MTTRLAVGLDLGTSGLKAIALDESGAVVARGSAAYSTSRPEFGASEQDPHDWIAAVVAVAQQIRSATEDAPWAVIGLSGMIPTLVTVDGHLSPTGPAITWQDGRAEPEGDALRIAIGPCELYSRTGQWVDGRYLLPMLARLARVEPDRITRSTTLLGAKDYLFAWLTGEVATDPSTATGFGCFDLAQDAWDNAIVTAATDIAGVSLALPEVRPSASTSALTAAAAAALGVAAGVPVCLGAADSVLGAVGMGCHEPGDIAYVGGTSTIVLGVTDHIELDDQHRFLVTPMAASGRFGLEMDLLATGSAFRWLAGLMGIDDEAALLALAETSVVDDTPVFLPFVAPGEQGALWDPDLTGSVTGLHVGHTRADLARALVNGIVLESRRCLSTLEESGFGAGPLRVGGGSASSPWFRQQLADASGRVVISAGGGQTDRSAAGAAAVGAASMGWSVSLAAVDGEQSVPETVAAARWSDAADRHESFLTAIRGQG
jgi:xylulokinase